MIKKRKIERVFTPRNNIVNKKMYIHRDILEKELIRKINGTKHIIIYGDSGVGKSWLYKKVLSDERIQYSIINLANAKRLKGITNIFKYEIAECEKYEKTKYTDITNAEASAIVVKGKLEHHNIYEIMDEDPLRKYINRISKGDGIIVLDNLESIFGYNELMQELGDILTLLDDENYNAKFLIVGVPSGVIEYFNNRDLLRTVSNRLTELPEVKGLSKLQVREFIKKGFKLELNIDIDNYELELMSEHIYWITSGIPQKVQEYCEILAYIIEDNNWIYDKKQIEIADKKIVLDNLHKNYLLISDMMNSNETNVGRRNQVLYCLGKINKTVFKVSELESIIRTEFTKSTYGKGLNVRLILNELSDWSNSFIKRQGKEYIIIDTQYILCIRMMLIKTSNEKIEKMDISNISQLI